MKGIYKVCYTGIVGIVCFVLFSFNSDKKVESSFTFPYKQAGLTDRQAAAHLLSRFTFGAKPGQVDEVLGMGLEKWFQQQLNAGASDEDLNKQLQKYPALQMSNAEIAANFAKPAQVLRMAVKEGVVVKDSLTKLDKAAYKAVLATYMQQKGLQPQKELFRQLAAQKIVRATFSNNQLQEVLTDFWFNHFNVSITKNICAEFIPAYEREVIRPNVAGKFSDLLLATAKSPAMLLYLDNAVSSATNSGFEKTGNGAFAQKLQNRIKNAAGDSAFMQTLNKIKNRKKGQGLNENYAREVMELHTLGVDGGYTQNDVTQAARILTGWTVYPMGNYGSVNALKNIIKRVGEDKLVQRGFVHEGDFLFAANRHDNGDKVVLGKYFKGNGYEEGVQLLNMLARHPSTAKFISRKIAVRFVSDNPSTVLVEKMAKTFLEKEGDIKQVLLTMVTAPEFWKNAVREKTKSPFELAISAVRSLNVEVHMPYQLYTWIDKMGQKLYFYQAPTGFPDKGQYWINSGALLNRMNFGLALASHRIPGVKVDLTSLNNGHEPESAEAALLTYGKLIIPERDLRESVRRLTPLLKDPTLQEKVESKAASQPLLRQTDDLDDESDKMKDNNMEDKKRGVRKTVHLSDRVKGSNTMLSQVVGIIIGSPEFQRR